jgi:hypothetical protein
MLSSTTTGPHKTESVRMWLLAHPRFPVPLHAEVFIRRCFR